MQVELRVATGRLRSAFEGGYTVHSIRACIGGSNLLISVRRAISPSTTLSERIPVAEWGWFRQ